MRSVNVSTTRPRTGC